MAGDYPGVRPDADVELDLTPQVTELSTRTS